MRPTLTPPTKVTSSVISSVIGLCSLLGYASGAYAQTTTVAPTPYQTVFDAGGDPVSGSCVWTYLASTSTPATTYQAAGAIGVVTPHANPIQADSAGRFTVFLAPGISYKFVYEFACTPPAHGAVIRTVDGITGVMAGIANPTVEVHTADVRCSLTSGLAVTTADVLAATTIYVVPYNGNRIALYDGASWNLRTVTNTGLVVPAIANSAVDLYAREVGGIATYAMSAWGGAVRATPLSSQDGVVTMDAANPRNRYLCTLHTTAVAGQTEDSATKRFVSNYDHPVPRPLLKQDATANWNYSTNTWRQARATVTNQVEVVLGTARVIHLTVTGLANNTTANGDIHVAIGENSTTVPVVGLNGGSGFAPFTATYAGAVRATLDAEGLVGYVAYVWLEKANAGATGGTYAWTGTGATIAGLSGWIAQ